MHSIAVVIVPILFRIVLSQDSPFVKIPQGDLQGKYFITRNGRTISGFLGIPYAEAPIGKLRFKNPKSANGWEGVRKADVHGNVCPQNNLLIPHLQNITIGNEDCLYLDVYTPAIKYNTYLPVMVFIHGGGFFAGSSSDVNPDYFLDRDIVLVAMNYRLGALGFLSTEDNILPGNYGLKDQTEALHWVQRNIEYFGGNKNLVTIFGESAGGASVSLHTISPLSHGLFQAGIAQSGTAHCLWVTYPPGINKKHALDAAKLVGCYEENSYKLINCLRNVSFERLAKLSYDLLEWDVDPIVYFRPSIEIEGSENPFLMLYPSQSISSVPLIIGLTSEEGAMKMSSLTKDGLEEGLNKFNTDFDDIIILTLLLEGKTNFPKEVVGKIKKEYFNDKVINTDAQRELLDLFGDSYFLHGIMTTVQFHKGPLYFYYFNYRGNYTLSYNFGNTKDYFGVSHADDLIYLFSFKHLPKLTGKDLDVSQKLIELWTNFATFRHPTPLNPSFTFWEPTTTRGNKYLHISNDGFVIKENLLKKKADFWISLGLKDNLKFNKQKKNQVHTDEL